jgi:flagellar basal body-associated protein FliL
MPRVEYRPIRPAPSQGVPRSLALLSRVLLVLALALALVIAAGTVYALIFRGASAPAPAPQPASAPAPPASPDAAIFTGLGRLRCPTGGPKAGVAILQASFPYFPGDRPFSEELVSRLGEFRALTAAYFAALSPEELRGKSEAEVKAELLGSYNALLRLGRIQTLYFNEYMLLE